MTSVSTVDSVGRSCLPEERVGSEGIGPRVGNFGPARIFAGAKIEVAIEGEKCEAVGSRGALSFPVTTEGATVSAIVERGAIVETVGETIGALSCP
jgi:hypothetical protein